MEFILHIFLYISHLGLMLCIIFNKDSQIKHSNVSYKIYRMERCYMLVFHYHSNYQPTNPFPTKSHAVQTVAAVLGSQAPSSKHIVCCAVKEAAMNTCRNLYFHAYVALWFLFKVELFLFCKCLPPSALHILTKS